MLTLKRFAKHTLAVAALAIAAAMLVPALAFAAGDVTLVYEYDAGNGTTGVSDEVTKLEVSKLDADTHEYVRGASLAILDKATGQVMMDWVTGTDAKNVYKTLDVNTTYILREITAPTGYDVAPDTEFTIDNYGNVTINGSQAELLGKYALALYDKHKTTTNEVTVKNTTSRTVAPKTGDETPLELVGCLIAAGVALIAILQFFKRRIKD